MSEPVTRYEGMGANIVVEMQAKLEAEQRRYDALAATLETVTQERDTLLKEHEKFLAYQCPKAAPSCLMCGQVKPFTTKHMVLGSIGICGDCTNLQAALAVAQGRVTELENKNKLCDICHTVHCGHHGLAE